MRKTEGVNLTESHYGATRIFRFFILMLEPQQPANRANFHLHTNLELEEHQRQ